MLDARTASGESPWIVGGEVRLNGPDDTVEAIVSESGEPNGRDAESWVNDWLSHPHHALGGQVPIDYLDTDEGCDRLVQLLRQPQAGAYA